MGNWTGTAPYAVIRTSDWRPTSGSSGLGCRMIGQSGASRTFCHAPPGCFEGLDYSRGFDRRIFTGGIPITYHAVRDWVYCTYPHAVVYV